jgi:saccharopine dehydrogenase-like NADP-dependent oxidoreductase
MKGMKYVTVAVVGASGMLGSMVLDVLSRDERFKLIATVRSKESAKGGLNYYKNVEWRVLDAEEIHVAKLSEAIDDASWVINNIGIIKPYIHDDIQALKVIMLKVTRMTHWTFMVKPRVAAKHL